jgi:hypothetical protein
MLSTMSRCADFFWNFQNGRRCHGNGQNAKELKNTKMIIAGYSPNRNSAILKIPKKVCTSTHSA